MPKIEADTDNHMKKMKNTNVSMNITTFVCNPMVHAMAMNATMRTAIFKKLPDVMLNIVLFQMGKLPGVMLNIVLFRMGSFSHSFSKCFMLDPGNPR